MDDRRLHYAGSLPTTQHAANYLLNGYRTFFALFIISIACIGLLTKPILADSGQADAHAHDLALGPSETNAMSATVEIMTATPSTAESIHVRASGMWRNSCIPNYDRQIIAGNSVQIFAVAEPADLVCGSVETEWAFEADLDLSIPDSYMIEVFVMSEWYEGYQLYTSTSLWVEGAIHHSPEAPQIEDIVSIVVDGLNSDGCVPSYTSHKISDDLITIDASRPGPDMACGQVVTPWSFDVNMGTLEAGTYTVKAYITSYIANGSIRELYRESEILVGSVAQRTGQKDYFLYIPGLFFE